MTTLLDKDILKEEFEVDEPGGPCHIIDEGSDLYISLCGKPMGGLDIHNDEECGGKHEQCRDCNNAWEARYGSWDKPD